MYIGKSQDIELRIRIHLNALDRRDTVKENGLLIKVLDKYGENSLFFSILEECKITELDEKEIYYIKELSTKTPNGYNLTSGGGGVTGYKHSPEKIAKMSGKNNRLYGKRKELTPMYGKTHTEETKQKLRKQLSREGSPVFGTKHSNSASKYYGVYVNNHVSKKDNGKCYEKIYYVTSLRVNKKKYTLGYFKDEILAAEMYDKFVIQYKLKNPLNFPNKEYFLNLDNRFPELENLRDI